MTPATGNSGGWRYTQATRVAPELFVWRGYVVSRDNPVLTPNPVLAEDVRSHRPDPIRTHFLELVEEERVNWGRDGF